MSWFQTVIDNPAFLGHYVGDTGHKRPNWGKSKELNEKFQFWWNGSFIFVDIMILKRYLRNKKEIV